MTLKESVILFLKGGPVKHGIALFAEHGNDPMFLRLCKMNPRGNRALLEKQLATIAGINAKEFNEIKNGKTKQSSRNSGQAYGNIKQKAKPGEKPRDTKSIGSGERSNTQKLRDQYPFLSRPDCPPELHQLISMKITAYHNYVEGHRKLFDAQGLDDCLDKARFVVDNYKENRLIGKELDYYKDHKTILGLHPIFGTYKKISRFKQMNVIDLVQKLHALEHNIWRIESEIKKGDKPHLLSKRTKQLELKQVELAELKRMLNVQ